MLIRCTQRVTEHDMQNMETMLELKRFNKIPTAALAGVAQCMSADLKTEGSPVRFPVRAHAWVAGQVPSRGRTRGNHTLMFLPFSFSFPSPLSKDK